MCEKHETDLKGRLARYRGAQLLDLFIERLCEAIGNAPSDITPISPEQTEKLKSGFFERVKAGGDLQMTWEKFERDALERHTMLIAEKVKLLDVVLFSSKDRSTGAVCLAAGPILQNTFAVWETVDGDLCLASANLQDGFCLEDNFYTPTGEYKPNGIYELTVWGLFCLDRTGTPPIG